MRFVFFSFSLLVRNKNNKCTSKTSNKVLRIKLRVCVEFNHKAISDFFCAYCCCRCCYSILSPSFLFFRCFFCNRSVAPNVVSLFNFDFTQTFFFCSLLRLEWFSGFSMVGKQFDLHTKLHHLPCRPIDFVIIFYFFKISKPSFEM